MAAPTNTKRDKEKIMEEANAAALKAEEMRRAGVVQMDGLSPTGLPESTIGMSKSEKFFSQGRLLDQSQREGYKSFGDKATGEGINRMRAAQGLPPISNTPKEFTENINKSVGFGSESALRDQEGRDRALKSGIGAGLSYEEADAAVTKAYNFLKGKYGDKTTPTTPTTPTSPTTPTPTPVPPPSSSAPVSPTLPPEVPVEKGSVMQFFDDVLEGGGPERALVKSGSLVLKGMDEARTAKTAAEAAAEAAAKVGGAVGDATKPFNMIEDAANTAAERVRQKYNFTKPAGDATKPFSMLDDVAKVAGATDEAAKVAGKVGDVGARMRKTQAVSAADEVAGATDEAAKVVGKAGDVGARMRQTQAAGAADGVTGAADEAASAADEAASAADEAAAAAGQGKGAVSRLAEKAASSRLAKVAAATARGTGKGLRVVGKVAGPALEVYDAGRYFVGDQDVKDQYAKDVSTLGQRVFQPKSFGEFAGGVGDVLSPTKNVLGTAETVKQVLKSQRGAREAEASLKYAQSVMKAQDERRKELYPDEEFNKLPRETQRQIRQAIRKEFSDAGVKTFGRYQ
jgi:hypothetical protein